MNASNYILLVAVLCLQWSLVCAGLDAARRGDSEGQAWRRIGFAAPVLLTLALATLQWWRRENEAQFVPWFVGATAAAWLGWILLWHGRAAARRLIRELGWLFIMAGHASALGLAAWAIGEAFARRQTLPELNMAVLAGLLAATQVLAITSASFLTGATLHGLLQAWSLRAFERNRAATEDWPGTEAMPEGAGDDSIPMLRRASRLALLAVGIRLGAILIGLALGGLAHPLGLRFFLHHLLSERGSSWMLMVRLGVGLGFPFLQALAGCALSPPEAPSRALELFLPMLILVTTGEVVAAGLMLGLWGVAL